jgi:hypothetical protein
VGLSWVLPFSWEFVEIGRWLPSAPVAVMATEEAFVVCQVNVTAWPAAMLLLLVEKARVGIDFPPPSAELEPQPDNVMSGEMSATPNRTFKHVASTRILLLCVLLPRLVTAVCNVVLLNGESGTSDIPIGPRLVSIHFHCPH